MAGFNRFLEIMNIEPEIVDKPGAITLKDVKGHISFNNVCFSYDNKSQVFSNIALRVQPGKQ